MILEELIPTLEKIAPLELAEDWDNVGLLAGDRQQEINKVMLTIDLTPSVIKEAKAWGAELVLAYHPPLWEPLKSVVAGQGPAPLLYELIRSNIAVYSFHTALDIARGGINDVLAELVGIVNPQPLQRKKPVTGDLYKLVVYIPEEHIEAVTGAIFAAGGGCIGNYGKCGFRCRGLGTFQGKQTTHPAIGKAGRFEQVQEYRWETIVPAGLLPGVIKAMLQAHPYEEVAYDVFPMVTNLSDYGLGRYGKLARSISVAGMMELIKQKLHVKTVGLIGPRRRKIKTAAVAAGSCGTLLREVIRRNCDFYLTGELKHHHALELQNASVTTVCVSHSNSERIILPKIAAALRNSCQELELKISLKDKDPFTWL